jgi:thioredoxin-dependent peroxiredoxin
MAVRQRVDVHASAASASFLRLFTAQFMALLLAWAVPGPFAHSAPAPETGMAAPAFHLADQAGIWHNSGEYRGKWLVLYFYPKDDTPGCTTQACEFRDDIFAFNKLGAVIVGISVDDVASHQQFAEEHSLPFTLLADSTKETAQSYGVLHSVLGIMEVAGRETFIIDPQGRIAKHYAAVDPKGHSKAVLADLKALQAQAGHGKANQR